MAVIRQQRGLMAKIAGEIGITRAAVAMWRRVPAERVADVSAVTGIPRHELRPDLFQAPDAQPERAA